MIHSTAPYGGAVTYQAQGRSRRNSRLGVCGLVIVALLAGSGALVGGGQARDSAPDILPPGPFSYFPR